MSIFDWLLRLLGWKKHATKQTPQSASNKNKKRPNQKRRIGLEGLEGRQMP
jgi:hypothetical protein